MSRSSCNFRQDLVEEDMEGLLAAGLVDLLAVGLVWVHRRSMVRSDNPLRSKRHPYHTILQKSSNR